MQLQTLTALRESVTPVKEFAPPSNGLDLNCSQARKIEEVYRTGLGKNEEAFPQASNYSTLQDDRANHKT